MARPSRPNRASPLLTRHAAWAFSVLLAALCIPTIAPAGPVQHELDVDSSPLGLSATTENPHQASALPMKGEWRLVAIDSTMLGRGGTPTVVFGVEGQCWGSTGVNDFRTQVKLEGPRHDRLVVGNASMTRKMGPPEAMALERLFLDRLESAESYKIDGNRLYLHTGEDQKLTFERVIP